MFDHYTIIVTIPSLFSSFMLLLYNIYVFISIARMKIDTMSIIILIFAFVLIIYVLYVFYLEINAKYNIKKINSKTMPSSHRARLYGIIFSIPIFLYIFSSYRKINL